jgi:hypothetical protein
VLVRGGLGKRGRYRRISNIGDPKKLSGKTKIAILYVKIQGISSAQPMASWFDFLLVARYLLAVF